MTNADGRKPEGAPERSPKAGAGAPSDVEGNGPKRFSVSRLLKKGRLPLTLNCESDSYANKGMAGGIDARFGCADG